MFKNPHLLSALPYLTLLFWVAPLLLLKSPQQSLMAHDEGIYALHAKAIVNLGDWIRPGGTFSYDRTLGIQWLIAASYMLFGISEDSARLPSAIACLFSVLLTYKIGCILLNPRLALLGAAILSVIPLWVQFGRLGTQDALLVFLELLAIWAFLQAERHVQHRRYWVTLAGFSLGLGFLAKGFMIVPAAIALLPYLIFHHHRHRHLSNPWLYLGLFLGFLPTVLWLWVSASRYGLLPFKRLIGKLVHLSDNEYAGNGLLYYLWNIPANAFPWALFALIGLVLAWRNAKVNDLLRTRHAWPILIGYPLILFVELTLFKTRTRYYPLQLLPFMALLAAIAFDWLLGIYAKRDRAQNRLLATLSYGFGGLAWVLFLAGLTVVIAFAANVSFPGVDLAEIQPYAAIALAVGLGWGMLLIVWLRRRQMEDLSLSARQWLAAWLIGSWLGAGMLGLTGEWGDYNSDLKAFVRLPAIASILQSQPIDFVLEDSMNSKNRKTHLLLEFYTPQSGVESEKVSCLQPNDYAWISPKLAVQPSFNYLVVGSIRKWQLIQVLHQAPSAEPCPVICAFGVCHIADKGDRVTSTAIAQPSSPLPQSLWAMK